VTQQQWEAVMGSNPSDFKGAALPVENVSWNDVMTRFIPRLNDMGMGSYRLPTEAEWEYAARAGSWQAYYQREDASQLDTYAWYTNNSRFQTHAVGTKVSNAWGLYDMHGNIWEWCNDWYNGPYSKEPQTDPAGPQRGLGRVMRGGSWFCNAAACRLATRGYMPPETRIRLIGFRLVRELDHLLET
ncbi:MAG: formylglycine-generating enzyme family protein, partial [Candidatus Sericytochromatia bacterium]